MHNKKIINAWAMYDWANSVYSLVITSTIFPIYYESVTKKGEGPGSDLVLFFGKKIVNTVLYSYGISFSFLLVALMLPVLSGIADYTGNKKYFMKWFVWLGSLSCMGLAFFTGENVELGIICSVLASVGFAGSLVFYNAYLPEITTPENYDRVSAKGFAMGYLGSVILLIINLAITMKPELFGLPDAGVASRVAFVTVGLWWLGFSQYSFRHLPVKRSERIHEPKLLTKGYRELKKVWHSLQGLPKTRNFLGAFFFYSMGVQTVMLLAATYGSKELELDTPVLIGSILAIQLVAIGGAYFFAWLSKKKGNILSLTTMILIWIGVCTAVFFINKAEVTPGMSEEEIAAAKGAVAMQFVSVAVVVGLIMGGIQSLSRSTYSKLLPPTEDHASYFSFYDVAEKISIVIGTFLFGFMEYYTHDMRNSVWPLLASFIIGGLILQTARSSKLKPSAVR